MRVNGSHAQKNTVAFSGKHFDLGQKAAKTFAKMDGIGEGASIAFDFLGKAVVVPAVIMLASKEPKEKKEYSALKNPVAAVIQLLLEVPILIFGSKAIEKAANNGGFDKGEKRLYNEKFSKDVFISSLDDAVKNNSDKAEMANEIISTLNSKGLTRKISENINDFIKTMPDEAQKILKQNFNNYKTTQKNLFHLQNRLCFIAAIIMTPILCALENKLHPIIMDKIYEKEQAVSNKNLNKQNTLKTDKIKHSISINAFIQNARRQK